MKNSALMWDDYYTTLNTDSYTRPPQSYYDFPTVNRVVIDLITNQIPHIIMKEHGVKKLFTYGTSMIELGCGGANISLYLLKQGFLSKSVMVDFSDKIKKYITNALDKEGFGVAKFVQADVLKLKVKERFDIVYSGGLLDHFDGNDLSHAFKKHVELCKHGGYVITVVPYNSRLMNHVKTMHGIPESKLNYKLFEFDEMINYFRKHKLEVIYNSRHAISQRPHIVNQRPIREKIDNLCPWAIHNLHHVWRIYEFLEREYPNLPVRNLFLQLSDFVLMYGMMHGDYIITIGRKI